MRLLHRDPTTGRLRLRVESPSDLWRLARLVVPGNRVGASTTRRDPEAPEDAPAAQRERRRVWLTVRVEQTEFHEFTGHVRFTGMITEGPFDVGRHHTLDIAEGDELTLEKEVWEAGDEALIQEGLAARTEPTLTIACVDWGESSVVRVRGRTVEPVADVNRTISGKRFKGSQSEKDRRQYVEELLRVLVPEVPRSTAVVIAGPGFLKEEVVRELTEREPSAKAKTRVFPTAESGRVGIDELLRSGRASAALAESTAAVEASMVETLVRALAGGRRAAVGAAEVGEAMASGAVETLLVGEGVLRSPAVVPILDLARDQKTRVLIVRRDGDAGRRLHGLGDLGAILRYDWSPSAGRPSRGPER